jgi:uncharacterized pyridoxal phosphate-containing UPF0001 family protein
MPVSLSEIRERIARAEAEAGRAPGSVSLVAVSKVQPPERVGAVLDAGHRLFGENRVQEAAERWPGFQERYEGISLHLVGPLQTNKARQAMGMFDAIHSLDRPKLARTLARLAEETGHCPDLFVQVNTGEEPQKAGVLPADEAPAPHFALLAKIAARNDLAGLSMGMSGDFERAIALGATHVRVGSAIFGARESGTG